EYYGVEPDLCTLGKVIGGGFPLAAIAGRAEIMAHFDRAAVGDDGFLMQIGTLSGNPGAAAAGVGAARIPEPARPPRAPPPTGPRPLGAPPRAGRGVDAGVARAPQGAGPPAQGDGGPAVVRCVFSRRADPRLSRRLDRRPGACPPLQRAAARARHHEGR